MQSKLRILLAEDNVNDLKILLHALREGKIDFDFKSVQDPEEFTSSLTLFKPDIVLSDYLMPQFSGMEALRISKLLFPTIPFIIVTGSMNEETAVECLKAGADDYVIKEHLSAIVPAINSAINKYELSREKKKLQNELAEREEKYRSIFSVSGDAILIIEKDSQRIIDINDAAQRFYKYTPEEFLELTYSDLCAQLNEESQDLSSEIGININYHKKKGGIIFPVELSFSSYIQNTKTFEVIIVRDISEKLQFSEKLRHNTKRLQVLYDLTQRKFNFEKELIDYALEEIIKLSGSKFGCFHFIEEGQITSGYFKYLENMPFDIPLPSGHNCLLLENKQWKECILKKTPLIHNDIKLSGSKKASSGLQGKINKLLSVPLLEDNKPIGIINICNKDTDYNKEDILQLSLFVNEMWKIIQNRRHVEKIRHLSTVVEQSPVLIIITGNDGCIEYVNPKFSEVTGYSFEEALGKNPRMLKSNSNFTCNYENLWKTILSGKAWSGIFHNKKKNGELFWESAIISPVKNHLGEITHFIGIKEDITKKVEAEKELEKYRNHLEQMVTDRTVKLAQVNKQLANELEKEKAIEETVKEALNKEKELSSLKTRFISTISHEFRTPLTTIFSSTELLEMFGKNWDNEKQLKHYSRIKESLLYLTGLLDEVLAINRVETGKLKLNLEKKDVTKLCQALIEDAKSLSAGRHKILYKYELEEKEYFIDEKLLRYILNNLLSNAVKYSTNGGSIELKVESLKENLCFTVKDEGIGIPKIDQEHLFESFFRAGNVHPIKGSGLGLSIVKHSVELHKGRIQFESEENQGAKFTVYLPLIYPDKEMV